MCQLLLYLLVAELAFFSGCIRAQDDSCSNGVKLYSALDLAKEAFLNIKELFVECKNDTLQSSGTICFCDMRKRSEAYINVAVDMIKMAKRKYVACSGLSVEEPSPVQSRPPVAQSETSQNPRDCQDILRSGRNASGVYTIHVPLPGNEEKPLEVYCDMDTDGGGWTLIQRRDNYTVQEKFYRNWQSYKDGFGNVTRDFWLGNDNIHYLTVQADYSARFDMEDVHEEKRYALYDHFRVAGEDKDYQLFVTSYSGDAGDAMENHNDMKFSTMHKKNDLNRNGVNCAAKGESGWWFNDCSKTNPNGKYSPGLQDDFHKYIFWVTWKQFECLKAFQIKLRKFEGKLKNK